MELKRLYYCLKTNYHILLIVPYGIETIVVLLNVMCSCLLIVPYGIETAYRLFRPSSHLLLIVPYGIETIQH